MTLKNTQIDTRKALEFLSSTISDLFGRMQRYLALIVQMHEKLNNLLDAIDDLEKGELSHRIVPHSKLANIQVPFHMNEQEMDSTESKYTYTKLISSTEILGMSSDTNINLDSKMLEECYKIGTVFFCEVQFLTKYRGEHTCESAIYHYEHPKEIKKQCTFEYNPHLEPEPELLDA